MIRTDKTTITICLGSSCFSRGNNDNLTKLQALLQVRGLDGRVHLKGSRCEGRCVNGPILKVGDTVVESLRPEGLEEVLEAHL